MLRVTTDKKIQKELKRRMESHFSIINLENTTQIDKVCLKNGWLHAYKKEADFIETGNYREMFAVKIF